MSSLKKITIQGFKSIHNLNEFELTNLNVLIGANGSGKSNFIEFFKMLREMAEERLQSFTLNAGGGDGFFFNGPKETKKIFAELRFGLNGYRFEFTPRTDNTIYISKEEVRYFGGSGQGDWDVIGGNEKE